MGERGNWTRRATPRPWSPLIAAATGGGSWFEFGAVPRHQAGAQTASLHLLNGPQTNFQRSEPQVDAAYLAYYTKPC